MGVTKTLTVFSIRAGRNGSVWVRAGEAQVQGDGSLSLTLDVLPLDGRLHVRETFTQGTVPRPPLRAP